MKLMSVPHKQIKLNRAEFFQAIDFFPWIPFAFIPRTEKILFYFWEHFPIFYVITKSEENFF